MATKYNPKGDLDSISKAVWTVAMKKYIRVLRNGYEDLSSISQ